MRGFGFAVAVSGLAVWVTGVARAEIPATTASAFKPSVELAAGLSPQSIAVADVDGDGWLDLVVANNDTDDVSILFGKGDGSFESPLNVPLAEGPAAVQVADMTGDALPDIVVAGEIGSALRVAVQGEGRVFALGEESATGEGPEGVAVADFNRDGKLDAATANFFDIDGTVSVRLGRGDGSFYAGLCEDDVTACDLPGDCSGIGEGNCLAPAELEVVPPGSSLLGGPIALVSADVNKDGNADLVVANSDGDNVAVLRGNGDGTFELPLNFEVGAAPVAVTLADLDIDGNLDVVTADEEDFTVSVLFGIGDGTFGGATGLAVGSFPESVSVWDFNLDGRPDIAVANSLGTEDGVSILRGNGDGSFQPIEDFAIAGWSPISIASGDFNGDSKRDVVTANFDTPTVGEAISLLLNDGTVTVGDSDTDGVVGAGDVEATWLELFDGDGSTVLTVAGGGVQSGPGVDANGDEGVSAADIVQVVGLVASG